MRRIRVAFVGEFFRNPESTCFTHNHELQAFRPAGDDRIERELRRAAVHETGIEHVAVGRPARVVDRNDAVGFRMIRARAGFEDFACKAGGRFFGIFGCGRDIGGRRRKLRHVIDVDFKDEGAGEAVGAGRGNAEFLGNPCLESLADADGGKNGFPAGEEGVDRRSERLAHHGGVEKFARFLRPARKTEGHDIVDIEKGGFGFRIDNAIGDAVVKFDSIFRNLFGRHVRGDDLLNIEVEDEHALGCARNTGIGEVFRNPYADHFAFFGEGERFLHAGDEAFNSKNGRRFPMQGTGIKRMAVAKRPAGIADADKICLLNGLASVVGTGFENGKAGFRFGGVVRDCEAGRINMVGGCSVIMHVAGMRIGGISRCSGRIRCCIGRCRRGSRVLGDRLLFRFLVAADSRK